MGFAHLFRRDGLIGLKIEAADDDDDDPANEGGNHQPPDMPDQCKGAGRRGKADQWRCGAVFWDLDVLVMRRRFVGEAARLGEVRHGHRHNHGSVLERELREEVQGAAQRGRVEHGHVHAAVAACDGVGGHLLVGRARDEGGKGIVRSGRGFQMTLKGGQQVPVGGDLSDHGPGVAPEDRRRLFRAFSKSAHEAASSAPGIGLGLALSLWNPMAGTDTLFIEPKAAIAGALAGYLSLWSVYHLFRILTGKEGMGYGDFKLLATLGAWLGWKMLPLIILMSAVVGTITGILMIAFKRQERSVPIPFGPYLAAAGWIAMLWGTDIVSWYLDTMS